jgi:hypothetical protein
MQGRGGTVSGVANVRQGGMRRLTTFLPWLDMAALPAGLVFILALLVRIHVKIFPHFEGWFAGFDQGKYRLAAEAWATGRLDPTLHYYPPGYSLLAAPFVWFMPSQPFAIPDGVCLAASLVLFLALSKRLVPDPPGWRMCSAIAFLLACLGTATMRQTWTIPWNSSASMPFALGALLATLRLCEARSWHRAAVVGLMLGILAGIRPTDAIILAPCCALYALSDILLNRAFSLSALLALAGAAVAGLLAGALPFAAAHVAINGFAPGFYLTKSAGLGFDWRLLPLRWVTLVLDPRPLLPEGIGLAEGLPWIAPGIAGMLYLAVATRRQTDRAWRLIAGAVAAYWAMYLCYRDLQPYGLWRFYNLHYFKWSYPFLALAGMRLVVALSASGERRRASAAACAAMLAMIWQPVARTTDRSPVPADAAENGLAISQDLSGVQDAVFLPVEGLWRDVYFNAATLSADGKSFRNTRDFKLQPVAGGVLLQPARTLPKPPLLFRLGPDTSFDDTKSVVGVTEGFRLGLPCGILSHRAACASITY